MRTMAAPLVPPLVIARTWAGEAVEAGDVSPLEVRHAGSATKSPSNNVTTVIDRKRGTRGGDMALWYEIGERVARKGALGNGDHGGDGVWTAAARRRFDYTFRPSGALGIIHRAAKAETCFRSPYFQQCCPPLPFAPERSEVAMWILVGRI